MTEGGDDIYTHIILGIEHRVPIVELRGDMRCHILSAKNTFSAISLTVCAHCKKKRFNSKKNICSVKKNAFYNMIFEKCRIFAARI